MFGIDAKEIFQQKISDVIVVLFGIHLFAIVLNYIIKLIRPFLKKRASEYKNQKGKHSSDYSLLFDGWSQTKSNEICYECAGEIINDEYVGVFENLKTVIDTAENPSRAILDSSSLLKINMMSDTEFENALSLGNFIRKLSKRKCTSEAQTNITINPQLKLDFSCPELMCNDLIPGRGLDKADSSDSFLSISSKDSSHDFKKELEQIINELEGNEGQKEITDEDITLKKLQKYLKASLAKADIANSFRPRERPVSQENKVLESAIAEFEKELKPIKDQIQLLKECISGFDLVGNRARIDTPLSDFTSSFSGSGIFTESLSATTCCSTDMQGYYSSYHIVSGKNYGTLDAESKYKTVKKLDKIASKNKHKSTRLNKDSSIKVIQKAQDVSNPIDKSKPNNRSPIAEMYVKLSQNNSQSTCLIKGRKEKVASSDNAVTYRIDLNLNLAGVPAAPSSPSSQKPKQLKERAITPLTSDPDEILGKPSSTDVPL